MSMTPHRCALIVQKDIAEESGDGARVLAAAYRLEMYERPPEEWELHRPIFGIAAFLRNARPGEFFQFTSDTHDVHDPNARERASALARRAADEMTDGLFDALGLTTRQRTPQLREWLRRAATLHGPPVGFWRLAYDLAVYMAHPQVEVFAKYASRERDREAHARQQWYQRSGNGVTYGEPPPFA